MKAGADPKALCTWYNHKRKVNVDMCTVLGLLAVSVYISECAWNYAKTTIQYI